MTIPEFVRIAGLASIDFIAAWITVSVIVIGIYAVASILWNGGSK